MKRTTTSNVGNVLFVSISLFIWIGAHSALPRFIPLPTFTSNWTTIDVKDTPFLAIPHHLNTHPVLVKVHLRPPDGALGNFMFQAMTSVQRDTHSDESFAGAVYAYDIEYVYVWVPRDGRARNRYAFCTGWPQYTYDIHNRSPVCHKSVDVQVVVWGPEYFPEPSYNSSWRAIEVVGGNTFIDVFPSLYEYPSLVTVQIRSTEKNTEFYRRQIYADAAGATYTEGENKSAPYSGVVYGFNNMSVRVWTPSDAYKDRYLFYVGPGWGNGTLDGYIKTGEVCILAWVNLPGSGPKHDRTWIGDKLQGTFDHTLHMSSRDAGTLVDVKVRALSGNNTGFLFDTIGPGQSHFLTPTAHFGGLVAARRVGQISMVVFRPYHTTIGRVVNIGPDYGYGVHNQHTSEYMLHVKVWKLHKPPQCHKENGGCEHNCTDYLGYHVCSCWTGFELVAPLNRNCADINECVNNTSGCDHICVNTIGSYTCRCRAGFKLEKDGHTCTDVDECAEKTHNCSQFCTNTDGSYRCWCRSGFELGPDNTTCLDICGHELNPCEQICRHGNRRSHMPYICSCRRGFDLDPNQLNCTLTDACLVAQSCSHICHNNPLQRQRNSTDTTDATFTCSCRVGYVLGKDGVSCNLITTTKPTLVITSTKRTLTTTKIPTLTTVKTLVSSVPSTTSTISKSPFTLTKGSSVDVSSRRTYVSTVPKRPSTTTKSQPATTKSPSTSTNNQSTSINNQSTSTKSPATSTEIPTLVTLTTQVPSIPTVMSNTSSTSTTSPSTFTKSSRISASSKRTYVSTASKRPPTSTKSTSASSKSPSTSTKSPSPLTKRPSVAKTMAPSTTKALSPSTHPATTYPPPATTATPTPQPLTETPSCPYVWIMYALGGSSGLLLLILIFILIVYASSRSSRKCDGIVPGTERGAVYRGGSPVIKAWAMDF